MCGVPFCSEHNIIFSKYNVVRLSIDFDHNLDIDQSRNVAVPIQRTSVVEYVSIVLYLFETTRSISRFDHSRVIIVTQKRRNKQ